MDRGKESQYVSFKTGGVSVYKYCQMGAAFASLNFGDVPDYVCFMAHPTKTIYYLHLLGWITCGIAHNTITWMQSFGVYCQLVSFFRYNF